MNKFHLRTLTSADQEFLWEMLYESLYQPPDEPIFDRAIVSSPGLARYVENWGQPGDLGLIAEHRTGASIGAAWLRLLSEPGYGYVDEKTPELGIAVVPGWRGQGVGSALLSSLMELARDSYETLSLSVDARNDAKRLYLRLGFEVVRTEGNSITMVRRSVPSAVADGSEPH